MAASPKPALGSIGWFDMTSSDPETARRFYEQVVGWVSEPFDMGTHKDYTMRAPASSDPLAGICLEAGPAATGLPPVWMIYITVDDIDRRLALCVELGGAVQVPARSISGMGRFAVIRDPVGAHVALFEPEAGVATD
jgi:predicted enzyme related to lactoylglutathione lyase